MQLTEFNQAEKEQKAQALRRCCSAERWVQRMLKAGPFDSKSDLLESARIHWAAMSDDDWLEAFEGHPMIGDMDSLRKKYAASKGLSEREQSGVDQASEATLQALSDCNQRYLARHGFIFIVFATGKSADQMLSLIRQCLEQSTENERKRAAAEQLKITLLRLNQLIDA
ncbi:MAG: 2-oxo-4-hydroxy-4-carboxy-5-ureidoimidazoline decarboxylase [Saccharospirillum sp.]|nr:2-oxo-4-hydroxy-4-carboxy-5-ureidoimidazoline decarboxylase [Saccharospirillum sp.]